jgi:hypothetical protein
MSNPQDIQALFRAWIKEVADKAKQDSLQGESDIGSIYRDTEVNFNRLSEADIDRISADIAQATRTKEGARRLINAIASAAKVIVKLYPS